MQRELKIARILATVFLLNLAVAGARFWLFTKTGSAGIFADAWHAAGDTVGSLVLLFGLCLSSRPPDQEHPEGYGKYEARAIRFVGALITSSAVIAGYEAYQRLTSAHLLTFSFWKLFFFCVTIVVGIVVTRLEHRGGDRHNSASLHADAEHTKADVGASLAVLIGYGAVAFGFSLLDPIAGFCIAAYICYKGVKILVKGRAH